MNLFERQIKMAKDNYNYFFVKLILCIFKIIFKLAVVLLLSSIFNYTIINIIALIYTVYSLYDISNVCKYYFNIIDDIKMTLGYSELSFEIDFNMIRGDILKGVVKYGK